MNVECPKEVQTRLLKILEFTLSRIRNCADKRDYERCGIEANHVHNLPGLIANFSREKLLYYLDIEVPQYLRETNKQVYSVMPEAWEFLTEWVQKNPPPAPDTH